MENHKGHGLDSSQGQGEFDSLLHREFVLTHRDQVTIDF